MAGAAMKKFVISLIILLLLAGTVFFFGWVQFAVPAGMYGVMVSKTGGVDPETVIPGQFRWQWERLLPTNTKLYKFSLAPRTKNITISGELPSAPIYSSMMEGRPDFSYKIDAAVSLAPKPSSLPSLVKDRGISGQEELDAFTDSSMQQVAEAAVQYVISSSIDNPAEQMLVTVNGQELPGKIDAAARFPDFDIISLSVSPEKIPDIGLYMIAKEAYTAYQKQAAAAVTRAAENQAASSVSGYFQIEQLSRLGQILTEYPVLVQFFEATGSGIKAILPDIETSAGGRQAADTPSGQ